MPYADLRSAYGSDTALGAHPAAKRPTRESRRSDTDTCTQRGGTPYKLCARVFSRQRALRAAGREVRPERCHTGHMCTTGWAGRTRHRHVQGSAPGGTLMAGRCDQERTGSAKGEHGHEAARGWQATIMASHGLLRASRLKEALQNPCACPKLARTSAASCA